MVCRLKIFRTLYLFYFIVKCALKRQLHLNVKSMKKTKCTIMISLSRAIECCAYCHISEHFEFYYVTSHLEPMEPFRGGGCSDCAQGAGGARAGGHRTKIIRKKRKKKFCDRRTDGRTRARIQYIAFFGKDPI